MDGDSDDERVPVTPRLLADLQAGLLDDDVAARLRRQAREEPDAARVVAALERVRRDLAALGVDATSAPGVPRDVTARMHAALRNANGTSNWREPTHAARRLAFPLRSIVTAVGAAAAVAAVGVGTVMLVRSPAPSTSPDPTIESMTADQSSGAVPLSDPDILGLLNSRANFGPLSDPQRRASCLSGLGYSTSAVVVGARPLTVNGTPGVLLLLAGATPHTVTALVVAPNCSAVDTGLLAEKVVTRP